jgi:pyruvate dehydrogenase E2 component (dihydrolipoamide acetyltransferase)
VALALQRVPEANAAWAEDSILRFRQSDVAVAVAVEGGLFTPVIRHAETKSINALSREIKALAERAQGRRLEPAEYQGGSITISNLGMYGVREFAAIVNPPQAAILAVGAAERRPVEGADGSVRFGSVMSLTLSCDHRLIDGPLGARLLAAIKERLESPLLLLA